MMSRKTISKILKPNWVIIFIFIGCTESPLDSPVKDHDELTQALDVYIDDNFVEPYNMAVRYKFKDYYINPGESTTPVSLDKVIPMLDFIKDFWIDPYFEVDNGEEFFLRFVPAEIIFLGGLIYNSNGTATLGTADAGARITFTNVNAFDLNDTGWRDLQLHVVYHEFAHSVHQNFKLPTGFETITPNGYSSAGSWFTIPDEEALIRGFTSAYATSSPNEDFAETVSFYLFYPDFFEDFINQEENCTTADCENRNAGRLKIEEKMNAIVDHYQKVTGVDLNQLRDAIQSRL